MSKPKALFAIVLFFTGATSFVGTAFAAERLKAEQIAILNDGYVACLTEEAAWRFVEHQIRAERTKMNAMFKDTCVEVQQGIKVKLISVRGAMAEFVPINSQASNGFWAPIETFAPANK
jgi:hypothetical protein